MNRLSVLVLSGLFVACVVTGCSRTPPATTTETPSIEEGKPIRSIDVVQAATQPVEISAGGSVETTVSLNIQPGYHVNANPPTFAYLKATELSFPASEGVSVGFIIYPAPLTRQFEFEKQPLAVYEGQTAVKVRLKAEGGAKKGARDLKGTLLVQACDEKVCYAPGNLDVTIPVTVK